MCIGYVMSTLCYKISVAYQLDLVAGVAAWKPKDYCSIPGKTWNFYIMLKYYMKDIVLYGR